MNTRELIEYLREQDPEAPVHFAYDSGDGTNTFISRPVEEVLEAKIFFSEVHEHHIIIPNGEETGNDVLVVVVLR